MSTIVRSLVVVGALLVAGSAFAYVGPLPAEVQRLAVFAASINAGARSPDAALAFIRFLGSPDAARVMTNSGLEPMPRR